MQIDQGIGTDLFTPILSEMTGFTIETIVDEGLDRACGIEIMDNRLLVGDYATGEIIVFDMDNSFVEMGRIPTEGPGLTGITVGPDGSIWYVNRTMNSLTRMEPGEPSSTEEEAFAAQVRVFPNPTSGDLLVNFPAIVGNVGATLELTDLSGKKLLTMPNVSSSEQLDLSGFATGLYLLTIQTDDFFVTKKVAVN